MSNEPSLPIAHCSLLFDWMNRDEPTALTVIFDLHHAGDLREQRVVLAEADVEAGQVLAPALAHEDRAAGHEVAVEALDAEPLRVAVAAVTRRSLSFFCRHGTYTWMSVIRTRV